MLQEEIVKKKRIWARKWIEDREPTGGCILLYAAASVQYKIPRISLLYKIKGKYSVDCKSGLDTVLTAEEETILSNWIIQVGNTGFPITKDSLLDCVALLVKTLSN
ncbi:hypothetical protein QE152_g25539 [Popillia japonica]|uniref:HTH CENPB-type domain-containing protein n=1 Tax=Popillia japonica TaxID=7064 RepID=A0AAW1K1G9_POPJA